MNRASAQSLHQTQIKKKKAMSDNITQQFTLDSLPTDERAQAVRIGKTLTATAVKGLLHRLDPSGFALDGDVTGIETPGAVAAQQIDAPIFERMKPRLVQLRGDGERFTGLTGLTIDQLKRPGAVKAPRGAAPGAPPPPPPSPPSPPKYKALDLNLRGLHCVDETNPESGTDDMVLGAMRVGASGNVGYTPAIVAGEFNDNTYRYFGELPFGTVSLRSTNTWPKTFYWIFQLVESDSDDAEVAAGVTACFKYVATYVVGAFLGAGAGAIAGGIVTALGSLIGIFIDEDYFSPYGEAIKLNSENDYGADGIKDWHTGYISAHGGTYVIGYRLRLK